MSEEVKNLKASQIFVPNKFPKYTYVNRGSDALEKKLINALETSNSVISLSGPSKSGKTVLVEKMVGADYLITVSGAELSKSPIRKFFKLDNA
ncbi:hypothetical protein, partial [Komagataeibacter europaeus]|uniref:hypothetical protein n=1 Tax=Komagataeibacter europaeus TaxID=33995 RepID=UPI00192E6F8F